MKKLFALVLLVLLCSSPVYGEERPPLTKEQQATLQTDIDILGICVVEALTPYVMVGFTTEYAVAKGFRICQNEGQAVLDTMSDMGLTEEEKGAVAQGLFANMVQVVDDARNTEAQRRLEEEMKKERSPKGTMIHINY